MGSRIYISIICDPDRAVALRESYPAIKPAYHFNKTHWNMVYIGGSLSRDHTTELTAHLYELVVKKLKKTDQNKVLEKDKV